MANQPKGATMDVPTIGGDPHLCSSLTISFRYRVEGGKLPLQSFHLIHNPLYPEFEQVFEQQVAHPATGQIALELNYEWDDLENCWIVRVMHLPDLDHDFLGGIEKLNLPFGSSVLTFGEAGNVLLHTIWYRDT